MTMPKLLTEAEQFRAYEKYHGYPAENAVKVIGWFDFMEGYRLSGSQMKQLLNLCEAAIKRVGRPLNGWDDLLEVSLGEYTKDLVRRALAEGFDEVVRIIIDEDGTVTMFTKDYAPLKR
jgi:hypothetical protein